MFAALLLRAMALEQAKTGTLRVSPRHPNVARRLGLRPDSPELGIAQRYLVDEDYIRPSDPGRNGDSFTITETGWEDLGYHATSAWSSSSGTARAAPRDARGQQRQLDGVELRRPRVPRLAAGVRPAGIRLHGRRGRTCRLDG